MMTLHLYGWRIIAWSTPRAPARLIYSSDKSWCCERTTQHQRNPPLLSLAHYARRSAEPCGVNRSFKNAQARRSFHRQRFTEQEQSIDGHNERSEVGHGRSPCPRSAYHHKTLT